MTGATAKQRVLVVDDDKEIVRLIRGYLRQAGYEVLVTYDGQTAMHILRADRPHLLILDLMLPDRDGWDITRTIRAELLEKGLGYAYSGMGRTLDTHVKNLRHKIEPDPGEPTYIQTVYGVGYRLADEDDLDHE
jgi:DNA-binding response OmpR family regulator